MIYKLDETQNALNNWIYIFMSLSIPQFRLVYDKLDFPFDPPEDLRQLAHDFALTREITWRNPEYVTVLEKVLRSPDAAILTTNLLEGTSSDDPYERRQEMLFTN